MTAAVTRGLLTGLAAHLATTGVGVWAPTGVVPVGAQPPIVLGVQPEAPDSVITLALASALDGVHGTTDAVVQARVRGVPGDTLSGLDVLDAVRDALHLLRGVELTGGVWVVLCTRTSAGGLGVDRSGRSEWTSNYLTTIQNHTVRAIA